MAQYAKEIGLLWAFVVSCVLINAADDRGRRVFLGEEFHSPGSSVVSNNGNFQGCESYKEYNDLIHLENSLECFSIDKVFPILRALHERSHQYGPGCMHDVIRHMKAYFSTHRANSQGCVCKGHVIYHPERYQNNPSTCINLNHEFENIYTFLFGNNAFQHLCVPYDKVLMHMGNLPLRLDNLDCHWEIINHYTTIIDDNGQDCSCIHGPMNAHTTPHHTHSTSTTMSPTHIPTVSVHYTCMKVDTLSTLGQGIKQANTLAGNCHPEISDHMAPEALVINMCNVSGHSDSWSRGPNVMSACEKIPLYTPVAIFFNEKYSSQGGLAGIFVGCLLDGFKMIVQECDKNVTVMHLVAGGHFQLDPVNYSIIM